MEAPDVFPFMMSFLKDNDYPLVHSMNNEEMANVFHISNRCFLVSWALKLLDEEVYLEILEDRENDKELLGNIVCQYGFCLEKDRIPFLNGELPVEKQVSILHRMFRFISRIKKFSSEKKHDSVTLQDIQNLINTNLNIFPTFGEIKILSEKEKCMKVLELEKEVQQIKMETKNFLDSSKTEKSKNICKINVRALQDTVTQLSENFYQFNRVIQTIRKSKSMEVKCDYKIYPNAEELLLKCNEYLRTISQYIKDLKTINEMSVGDVNEPDDEISPMIENLVDQIHKISRSI